VTRPVALALRALGLGDFLTGLPALSLLRHAIPDHSVVLAAPAVFAPLVPYVSAIDQLLPAGELMTLDRCYTGVDVAVDLHGKGPESRRLLAELQPVRLVGFADPTAGVPGPPWYAGEHEVARWCRLVATAFDLGHTPWPSVVGAVDVPEDDVVEGLTLVHPGAAAGSRRWPADRFAKVAAQLRREGHRVVITGRKAEASLAERVAAASGVPTMLDLPLLRLLSVVAAARLVVCGDTGIAHVASNYRTPSVLLFGPVRPAEWGPPDDPVHRVIFSGDGTGDPHGTDPDPALLRITAPEVLDAVHQVMGVVAAERWANSGGTTPRAPRVRGSQPAGRGS
jgi:ADP-heptose:LPS heptosyltransferase